MSNPRITQIEWATLQAARPRAAGRNARLPEHGGVVALPLARLTTEDGAAGFGYCRASAASAAAMLGQRLDDLFRAENGALLRDHLRGFEYPLWDLVGQRQRAPVYRLAAAVNGRRIPDRLHAPCYDTSLYFDDLHLSNSEDAAAFIASQAREGYEKGHRAFKIKVGRGSRHMPLEEGTRRDIMVIQAVREAVGTRCPLMIDANNGYNLNIVKQVLLATRSCRLFWLEEAFHEDPVLYEDLNAWQKENGLSVLTADGEGEASPRLLEWAKDGLIDVVQYDVFGHGFTRWLKTGRELDECGVRTAPHHYGGCFGNYAACHLAAGILGFTFAEWDEASAPGLDASGYQIADGYVTLPDRPGFGLDLDEERFQHALRENGGIAR